VRAHDSKINVLQASREQVYRLVIGKDAGLRTKVFDAIKHLEITKIAERELTERN